MDKNQSKAGYASVNDSDEAVRTTHNHTPYDSTPDDQPPYDRPKMEDTGSAFAAKQQTFDLDHSSQYGDGRTFWQKCNSFWVWELASSVVSFGALGADIWALVYMNNRPLANWPVGNWAFTAFLSFFVTFSRFAILVGVAEGIGQLRWLYYLGGSHRLDHLDSFESASRGPWGSILFLLRASIQGVTPTIARCGALIMIASLLMDTFTQQMLEFPVLPQYFTNDTDTWVLATNYLPIDSDSVLTTDVRRQALYSGLLGIPSTVSYNCPSGNCTWDPFTSLGYGINCSDVANLVEKECVGGYGVLNQNCTVIRHTVPNANLSVVLQNGSLTGTPDDARVFSFLNSNTTGGNPSGNQDPTLLRFLMAQLLIDRLADSFNTTQLSQATWNLTQCDIRYSAKLYEDLSVLNGTFRSVQPRVLDLVPLPNSQCWTNSSANCSEFTVSNVSAVPKSSSPNYIIELDGSPLNVRGYLQFDYNLTAFGPNFTSDDSTNGAYNIGTGLFWDRNITQTFQDVATTLTDYLRNTSAPVQVRGTTSVWTPYVKVKWGWFAVPAAVDVLGLVFLLVVIAYTAVGVKGERLIWKTNTIPLLMHGLQGYERHGYAGAETTGAIFRKARQMRVQLRRNKDGEIRFAKT